MEPQKPICPILPEVFCAQGFEAAQECARRMKMSFDPVAHIEDFLMMLCAAEIAAKRENAPTSNKMK